MILDYALFYLNLFLKRFWIRNAGLACLIGVFMRSVYKPLGFLKNLFFNHSDGTTSFLEGFLNCSELPLFEVMSNGP